MLNKLNMHRHISKISMLEFRKQITIDHRKIIKFLQYIKENLILKMICHGNVLKMYS